MNKEIPIVVDSPKVLGREQITVYLPLGSTISPGILQADSAYFDVDTYGKLSLKISAIKEQCKGEKGDTGNGIESTEVNDEHRLVLHFTNGTSYVSDSIRGPKGDKGDKGDVGNYIVMFYKAYDTLAQLNESVANQIDDGVPDFGLVIIRNDKTVTGENETATGRVYRKVRSAPGANYSYEYMADLSGMVGPPGKDADNNVIAARLEKYIDNKFLNAKW